MSEHARKLEQEVAAAWKSHVASTTMSYSVSQADLHFSVDLNDNEYGAIHFDIKKGPPVRFSAFRQWGDTKVPINRGLQYIVDMLRPGKNSLAERSVELFFKRLSETIPSVILQKLPYQKMLESEQARLKSLVNFDQVILREMGSHWSETIEVCRLAAIMDVNQAGDALSFYAAEGDVGVIRRQAAKSFPILAETIAKFGPIKRMIDEKVSFIDTLAQIIVVDGEPSVKSVRTVISKLSGVSIQFDDNHHHLTATQFVRLLTTLPIDWLPRQSGPDADALAMLTDMALPIMQQTRDPLSVIMQGAGGKWADFALRTVKAQIETRPPEGANQENFPELLSLSTVVPEMAQKFGPDLAVILFLKDLDDRKLVPEIVRTSIVSWLLDGKLISATKSRLLPSISIVEDIANGFSNRILSPLLMQAAGSAAIGGIPNIHHQSISDRAGSIIFKNKAFPAIMEGIKKFKNDITAFMYNNVPDDFTPAEIEQHQKAEENIRRQRDMDAIMAARAEIIAAEQSKSFDQFLGSLITGQVGGGDEQSKLRIFFGVDTPPEQVIWRPFTPIVQAPNGIYIVPLITPAQLYDEGGDFGKGYHKDKNGVSCLNICVGMHSKYSDNCVKKAHNVFSLRQIVKDDHGRETYERLACLDTRLVGNRSLSNEEFRGKKNAAVSMPAKVASDWFFDQIKSGGIPFCSEPAAWQKHGDEFILIAKDKATQYDVGGNAPGVRVHRNFAEERAREREAAIHSAQRVVSDRAGYEWRDARVLRSVLRSWSPLLPKAHRGLEIEQYKEVKEVKELIAQVFPATQSQFKIRQRH
jgi:hypothetical protein